jgi:CRISPR-associated protein Cas2
VQCLVVYDISDDARRTKVADVCLDYGLDRIQYSAFLGDLAVTHQEELMLKLKKVLGKKEGNIQLFPLCARDWAARKVIVNEGPGDKAG